MLFTGNLQVPHLPGSLGYRARMLSSSSEAKIEVHTEAKVDFLLHSGFCTPANHQGASLGLCGKETNPKEKGLQLTLVKLLLARPISDHLPMPLNPNPSRDLQAPLYPVCSLNREADAMSWLVLCQMTQVSHLRRENLN